MMDKANLIWPKDPSPSEALFQQVKLLVEEKKEVDQLVETLILLVLVAMAVLVMLE